MTRDERGGGAMRTTLIGGVSKVFACSRRVAAVAGLHMGRGATISSIRSCVRDVFPEWPFHEEKL